MRQSGHYLNSHSLTKDELLKRLYIAIDNLDIPAAREEVRPFIPVTSTIDIWSKEFFKAAAEKIVV